MFYSWTINRYTYVNNNEWEIYEIEDTEKGTKYGIKKI